MLLKWLVILRYLLYGLLLFTTAGGRCAKQRCDEATRAHLVQSASTGVRIAGASRLRLMLAAFGVMRNLFLGLLLFGDFLINILILHHLHHFPHKLLILLILVLPLLLTLRVLWLKLRDAEIGHKLRLLGYKLVLVLGH